MNQFWSNQDVFVNVSEYEGTSLSMLEAMSFGCVPVVTDVSGAREFIEENRNGYVCPVGDLSGISDCIEKLDEDRAKLKSFGMLCHKIIQERCNPDKYISYWMENLL